MNRVSADYLAWRRLLAVAVLALLTACGGSRPTAPISDRAAPQRQPESDSRTVVRGDTLYSIAWESGRDYKDLAAWNKIAPPYTIKPGQQIRLYPPGETRAATPKKIEAKPLPAPAPAKEPAAKAKKEPVPAKTEGADKPPDPKPPGKEFGPWAWPVKGKILNPFNETAGNKGLDIAGTRGQTIAAAADGRVVYQGGGLRGYGQLIIVKHSDDFLSAYAHNDKIHVKEGDQVKRGQKIAEMGNTGTDQIKLHFEIRRQGVPVDPLRYLPK
ncbi:MAG: peptidoglycan DD-metalloendopeptidase family protein [Gammaproteobacteria bacterium]|nr:peptidoglycan DD-metalloendopeptidase family protein [Gammaproteobacteria bacterium]